MKTLLLLLFSAFNLTAVEQPNILWITSEDNDTQWLGCYGNPQAQTPHLDQLASQSALFTNFYSNAPVCAVARSTILNGVHAPAQGTQHMRSRHPIPSEVHPYVTSLRKAGYYCTNASKTDYNFRGNDKALWDECSSRAHYRNRKEGQPFFAIFNLTESHESSLFPEKIQQRREKGLLPQTTRLSPAEVFLPPYLPDLPEIRSDIATYYDIITLLDSTIGERLLELREAGLAEDTIIFYYGDHGGILPRGKRYLTDTGVKVPLLIHVPEKWKKLSPFAKGSTIHEVASFVDLAPTLLSLIGQEKPAYMNGRALLGEKRTEPAPLNEAFLYADRFDEIYGMRRGLTDGRWKYIRRFTPQLPAAPYSYYQFNQAGWSSWQEAWQSGKLTEPFRTIWENNQAVEELYDTRNDRWEITNLATDPAHQERLLAMRQRLAHRMIAVQDTGIIPESMFADLAPNKPIAHYAKSRSKDWPNLVEAAFTASSRDSSQLHLLMERLSSTDPLERYWASQGCLVLGEQSSEAKIPLTKLLTDPHAAIRTSAAHTLIQLGEKEAGYPVLLKDLHNGENEYAQQEVINALKQLEALDRIDDQWVHQTLQRDNAGKYVKRFAVILAKERELTLPSSAE